MFETKYLNVSNCEKPHAIIKVSGAEKERSTKIDLIKNSPPRRFPSAKIPL
jgi:hypothetical protein